MKTAKHLLLTTILLGQFWVGLPHVLAQSRISVERRVHLSRGRTKTLRGKADSSTSYAYRLRAEKDQRLEARLTSEGGAATFSVVPPGAQSLENAAGVTQWAGTLPETGEYTIVVVMNTKEAGKFPYALELTIK